jgi:hypothetical protein
MSVAPFCAWLGERTRSTDALSEPPDARRLPHRDPGHDQQREDDEADGVLELRLERQSSLVPAHGLVERGVKWEGDGRVPELRLRGGSLEVLRRLPERDR